MDMDGWRDILHFDFYGEHVLFSSLRLSSGFHFLLASILTVTLCVLEKLITYALSSRWDPLALRTSRVGNAAFRTALYWIVTLIRLLYMLLAMTFHVGLILVVVTTLSAGQFAIEYLQADADSDRRLPDSMPLLGRRDFTHSVEYLEGPTRSTSAPDRLHGTSIRHSPRHKVEPPGNQAVRARDTNSNGTIFAIDDGEGTG